MLAILPQLLRVSRGDSPSMPNTPPWPRIKPKRMNIKILRTFNVVGTNTPEKVPSFFESSVDRVRCMCLSFLSTLPSRRGKGMCAATPSRLSSSPCSTCFVLCHSRDKPWSGFEAAWFWCPELSVEFTSWGRDQMVERQLRKRFRSLGDEPVCSLGSRRATSSSAVRVEKFGRLRDMAGSPFSAVKSNNTTRA